MLAYYRVLYLFEIRSLEVKEYKNNSPLEMLIKNPL